MNLSLFFALMQSCMRARWNRGGDAASRVNLLIKMNIKARMDMKKTRNYHSMQTRITRSHALWTATTQNPSLQMLSVFKISCLPILDKARDWPASISLGFRFVYSFYIFNVSFKFGIQVLSILTWRIWSQIKANWCQNIKTRKRKKYSVWKKLMCSREP